MNRNILSPQPSQYKFDYLSYLASSSNNDPQHRNWDQKHGNRRKRNHLTRKISANQQDALERIKQAAALTDQIGPEQMARIEKIRKEFPEFSFVDNRQLNQIMQLYDINIKSPIRPSSVSLIVQGTFFLWICWLFYNAGSTDTDYSHQNTVRQSPAPIVMNTILSSSAACVSVIFIRPLIISKIDPTNKYPVQAICNSLLVGLVSITGGCNNFEAWASVLIGIFGTFIYCLSCRLFEKLKIDDPLEASQIHAFCGLWGLLAVGFFDKNLGILYTGDFNLMLKQLIGAAAIIGWASLTSFLYFYCLKKVNKFRVGYIYEITGMDILMHGGTDLLSNDMINKIEERQRSLANANRLEDPQKTKHNGV